MKSPRLFVGCAVMTIVLSACTMATGRELDREKVSRIENGVTTRAEIIEIFGPPQAENSSLDGTSVLRYYYRVASAGPNAWALVPMVGSMRGIDSEGKGYAVTVTLNSANLVTSCIYREESMKTSGGIDSPTSTLERRCADVRTSAEGT